MKVKIVCLLGSILIYNHAHSASKNSFQTTTATFETAQTAAAIGNFTYILPLIFQSSINTYNINTADENNATLLYWAVYYNDLLITDALLKNGAEAGILAPQYTDETRPLDIAINNQNLPLIKILAGAAVLQDRVGFLSLFDQNSEYFDQTLAAEIENSSAEIQTFFTDLANLFLCDSPSNTANVDVASIAPANTNQPVLYTAVRLDNVLQNVVIPIDLVMSYTNLSDLQLKIYTKMPPNRYYAEAYDNEGELVGVTSIAEENTPATMRFFSTAQQPLFFLSLPNLNTVIEAIKKNLAVPLLDVIAPAHLCTLTTQNSFPMYIQGSSTPCNSISISCVNTTPVLDTYLNSTLLKVENLDPANLSIISASNTSQSFTNFMKNNFSAIANTFYANGVPKTSTILTPKSNFSDNYFFGSNPPLFDIKSANGPVMLLGSTTPFNEITYSIANGTPVLATLNAGVAVTVDNFDTNNVIITSSTETSQTLTSFIASKNFSGTFTFTAAPPIFDIFSQKNIPITVPESPTSFNQIKYFIVNGTTTLSIYNNGNLVDIPDLNILSITVVNSKTNTAETLSDFIAANDFSDTYYLTETPPLFKLKAQTPFSIVGSTGTLDEIRGYNTTETLTLSTFLAENPVTLSHVITENIAVIDAKNNSQTLTAFIAENNYSGTFSIAPIEPLFDLKTQSNAAVVIPGTTSKIDCVKYVVSDGIGTLYPYLQGNPVAATNISPADITLMNANNETQSLETFIKNNNFTETYFITTSPTIFTAKVKNRIPLRILGSTTPFDEIKYIKIGSTPISYTYLNGAPVTVDNFDTNNIMVTDQSGHSQTLASFVQANNYTGSYTISATPPLFDLKIKNDIPLRILGSTRTFDEVEYYLLQGTPTLAPCLNGAPVTIDNFDPNNVMVTDQNNSTQTLASFIQGNNYKGTFTITAAEPLFVLKSEGGPLQAAGATTAFDEVKYFMLKGRPIIAPYLNGAALKESSTFNPSTVYVGSSNNTSPQLLSDFISGKNYKGNFYLTATKK